MSLPEGLSHRTLLTFGDGIGATWRAWGQAMTDLSGKVRPANDADIGLKYFGYWTDNGAGYYYNYDRDKGYAGTLLALRNAMTNLGIPLAYMQLDSWWYVKSTRGPGGEQWEPTKNRSLPPASWNCYGGLMDYVAHPSLFPQGLGAFNESMGLPFITHNRWVDVNSPYRQKYQISGVGAVDPKWWDDIAEYLKISGVITYEQDWLNQIYENSPLMQSTMSDGEAFMDNMARACREQGLTMQYCMEQPRHYLQGTKYNNLTSVRVSDDRYQRIRWEPSLYVSQLAAALGEWPWVDTFNSSETPNLILATLTAGMVGVGDKIEEIDPANIRKAIRTDGVIVKPDTSIVPIDRMYLNDALKKESPMIAAAFTDHGKLRTAYVFAFPRNEKQMAIAFKPTELGIDRDAWVCDFTADQGQLVRAGGEFTSKFTADAANAWAYYIVAPVSPAGIAIIGDQGKFASCGRQRMKELHETAAGMEATIAFAPGENAIKLLGFAERQPIAKVDGNPATVNFDARTKRFLITVTRKETDANVSILK